MNALRRELTAETLASWPLYASLRRWSEILGYSQDNLRRARELGQLKGYIQGANRWYFTRTQILRWLAPGLGTEPKDLVKRIIEPGKDIAAETTATEGV
jgi:hypothetical protein